MKRILLFVKALVCLTFVFIACNNKTKTASQFYYYPKANMYYEIAEKNYVYSLDSGKTWLNIKDTTGKEPLTLGKKVLLTSKTDSIWKENEVHRKLYSGNLYNLTEKDSSIARTTNAVTERKKVVRKSSKTKVKRVEEKEIKRNNHFKVFRRILQ